MYVCMYVYECRKKCVCVVVERVDERDHSDSHSSAYIEKSDLMHTSGHNNICYKKPIHSSTQCV